jgi:hypothetical protein
MRRFLWLTLLLAAAAGRLFSQDGAPADALGSDIAAIAAFFPRAEGSSGERLLVQWIRTRLAGMGVASVSQDFSKSDFEHSFSMNLRVDVSGRSRDSLVIAVPLGTAPGAVEQRDGAVNIALALALIARWNSASPPLGITVLFLGAEFGESGEYPMGSTLFLRDFQPDFRAAFVYLNFRGIPSRVLVRGGGSGIVSPSWMMERCVAALDGAKVPFGVRGDENQVFRMGMSVERTAIEPYLKAGFPAVGLEGEYGRLDVAQENAWLARFPAALDSIVAAGASGIPEEWDKHYLLFQAGDSSLILTEKTYLAVLIGSLSALLLYSLVFRKGLKKYLRTLTRNFPAVIPLAVLCFAFLAAGTLALQAILSLRGFPTLWEYAPLPFLALKVGVALFLYAILYNLFRRLPFPRNGSFYSAAALLFLLADIVVVALFDISFTYYFLWAYLFFFLSALVRNRWAKVALFLPAPFWGVFGLITVFTAPALARRG